MAEIRAMRLLDVCMFEQPDLSPYKEIVKEGIEWKRIYLLDFDLFLRNASSLPFSSRLLVLPCSSSYTIPVL